MLTNEQIEVLRVLLRRAMDWETSTPASEALTAAISLAERVRDAPNAEVQMLGVLMLSDVDESALRLVGQRVALVGVE